MYLNKIILKGLIQGLDPLKKNLNLEKEIAEKVINLILEINKL